MKFLGLGQHALPRVARGWSVLFLTGILTLALLGVAPSSAGAAAATLSISPSSAKPGQAVTLSGSGFPGRANVTISWDGSRVRTVTARRDGTFKYAYTIPAKAQPGSHTLTASGGGLSVSSTVQVVGVTPAPSPSPTPAPSPSPTPAPTQPAPSPSSPQERILVLVNNARASAGLAPLTMNSALTNAAQSYAQTMASTNCFSHTCPPVPQASTRIEQAGYTGWTAWGENIAAGQKTADDVFNAWMNSPGHRANILNGSFRDLGVGVANGGSYGIYWVQNFGAR